MRKTMEQLSLTAGKEKENVVQILTDLMEHNREFQIMITVPARAAGEENSLEYVQAKEVINLRGTVIPLIRLNEVLDNESTKKPDENLLVIIVKKGDKLAGLVVDELMGQQEIVIKSLGNYINKNKIISGATILGDGEIALILDTNALL